MLMKSVKKTKNTGYVFAPYIPVVAGPGNRNSRIYDDGIFNEEMQRFLDQLRIEERAEEIDALIEDRKPKHKSYPLSSRGMVDHNGDFKLLSYDLTPPIGVSSRKFDDNK